MKRVLIIEDDEAVRENTAELLEISNFEVMTAENGKVGFELAKSFMPHIILCDMMMPETDGSAFLKLAKADPVLKHIPLVFFSAGTLPFTIQNRLIQASDGFLKKPFFREELLNSIETALAV